MQQYRIKTGERNGQTILKDVFYTPPFNLVDIREDRRNPLLEVMVMSSSPGMLNDDTYAISLDIIDQTALNVQTQSYQHIYVSESGTFQKMDVTVGKNAYFSYAPHPTVPHKDACFVAKNKINLQPSSTLLWTDIITCGRKYMKENEIFSFRKFHSCTEIWVGDELLYYDNQYVEPQLLNVHGMGQYEGYTHQGSLFFRSPEVTIDTKVDEIHQQLQQEKDIDFGVSKLREDAMVVRVLGHGGEHLFRIFDSIRKKEDELINQTK